ncbi:hypothetical protein [Paraburkholderia domus]|uniref:recombination directionality factor n=1 Tax=Paraburkholderia domus TaxID=2793075 RepID=UPI001B11A924|nr:hypothetical protein [Paraburkholderia domus]CAE6962871.1 hypothetical protein R70199_07453 [Paraburkholderia domus]
MSNANSMTNVAPRSMFEERPLRPPTIGKIRPGIKVLKSAARQNAQAVKLYDEMVAAGDSFETIDSVIERQCKVKNSLVPKNVEYFTCRRSDFTNPDIATEILRLYGEDRGEGLKLYKFPVVFAFNDWLENAPHQLTTWGQSGRKFFSTYEGGVRYCKTYPKVEHDERAKRAVKNFGMRIEVHRQDNAIPDGVCNTTLCPEFQSGQCKLNASLIFAIPDIKGLGLIELVTTSMYGIGKAREAMEMFAHANGRLSGNALWINKKQIDISRQKDGEYVRTLQWIPILNAEVDLSEGFARGTDSRQPVLRDARAGNVVDIADVRATMADDKAHAELVDPFSVPGDSSASESLVPDFPASGEEGEGSAIPEATAREQTAPPPAADPSLFDESVDDKRARLTWLLKDLDVTTRERQVMFSNYANVKYAEGWSFRPRDLDTMNDHLMVALHDRQTFEEEMKQTLAGLNQYA